MPVIACLGWGSLVWDPRELPVRSPWFEDGPPIKVDFLRQSGSDRVTLVLDESAVPVPSLWAIMDPTEVSAAKVALQKREGVLPKNLDKHIQAWSIGDANPPLITGLEAWATSREIDAVIWTALRPKFGNESDRVPTQDQVIEHLRGLTGVGRENAERYIRQTPRQIDTPYRRRIEAEPGWTPEH